MKEFIKKYLPTVVSGTLFAIGGIIMYCDGRRDERKYIVDTAKEIHALREQLDD